MNYTQRMKLGLIGAVVMLLLGIGLTTTGTVFTVTEVKVRRPVTNKPLVPSTREAPPSGMACPLNNPDETRADFEGKNGKKETPVSFGGPVTARNATELNHKIRDVLCGTDRNDPSVKLQRGPNRLVFEGIMFALKGDKLLWDYTTLGWHEFVRLLVEEQWKPHLTWFKCFPDKAGIKSVFGNDTGRSLKLGVDTIDTERKSSCYASLVFHYQDRDWVIRLRMDCLFQATSYGKATPTSKDDQWRIRWYGKTRS